MEDKPKPRREAQGEYEGKKRWFESHVAWLTEAAEASRKDQQDVDSPNLEESAETEDIADIPSHSYRMRQLWGSLSDKHRTVAAARLAPLDEQRTLVDVGEELGLTRERVRQIQVRILDHIDDTLEIETSRILEELEQRCGDIVLEEEFTRSLEEIVGSSEEPWDKAYTAYLMQRSDYRLVRGVRVARTGQEFLNFAKDLVNRSKEASIVDTKALTDINPDYWYRHRNLIVQCLGLSFLPNGSIATRDTLPVRVIDALRFMGGPVTKEELSELTGISEKALLSRLWCMDEVVKVANNMWALDKPGLTKYVGVVDMIEQILEEHGGEATVDFLREEIRSRCNVKDSSFNTFLATSRFFVSNGSVRLRRPNEIQLRPISKTIDGRTTNGAPYWTFTVQERHLQGNSVTGFPPELADMLGVSPNGFAWIPINQPTRCRDLRINWRLASANGVHIGYLRDVFESLNCKVGQELRLIVNRGKVEIQRHV